MATIRAMHSDTYWELFTLLAYRLANYATHNLIDDPALLALIFC